MTVAAIILAATPASALADTAGRPAVRRIVEGAWAGGAVPIVVVSSDPEGRVAEALAGSGAVLAEPAPPEAGPVGQIVRGMEVARQTVSETEAALVWPARMVWTDAETVTSLIQGHGMDRTSVLRPTWRAEPGWPVLVPLERLADLTALAPDRMPDELVSDLEAGGASVRLVDLGDPGTVMDRGTSLDDLPTYEGPPEPIGGPPPEWGAAVAERSDEGPLEGPALAPYGPA
jgi:CTP:molybdopterin cytidylyltransferase MocA